MQHNKVSHTVKRGNKNVKIRVENPTLTKRRKAECQILNGNTILAMGKPETEEDKQNNIWYVEISSLGDIYSVTPSKDAQFPKDWVEKLNNPTYGKNFGDTINTQFRSRAETEVSNRRFTAPRSTRNRSTRAQATRRTSTR